MLKHLRKYLSAPLPAAPVSEPPAAEPEAFDVARRDAELAGWFRTETKELFEGFPVQATDHVLDVGCGDGTYIAYCSALGAEVTFVDVDPAKVQEVQALLSDSPARAHGIVSDADPLPLPEAAFDKLIATEVLEHLEQPERLLEELYRVGKPGALYLLSVPSAASENVQKQLAPEIYFTKPNHINIFTPEQFEKMVVDAGFIVEHKAVYGFFASIWWALFWTCERDLSNPVHPLLQSWERTWALLLLSRDGLLIKRVLDQVLPKSHVIIARKP